MSQTFMPKPESTFPNEEDTFCLRTDANAINQRRGNRRTPDHQKDERYFEKRKKNYIAVKTVRDNKRRNAQWHRNRCVHLEEENALLRQEICVMKACLGIPTDTSILTDDKRENCLMINRTYMQDKGKAVDNVVSKKEIAVSNSLEHCRVDSMNEYADCENSRNGKAELDAGQGVSVYTPLGGGVLAIPSHVQSLQQYPSAHPGYSDAMPNAISTRKLPVATQFRYVKPDSPCSTERSDSDLTYQDPFDLLVNSTSKYETSEKYAISPDLLSDQNRQLKNENDKITMKRRTF
ncbi:hypothetical protein ACJMK2_016724 [Sinanodonta woodiana]|uniref:BZIP domain-containing protein n=1 Tax=Sinanodonta woodiana TaxID=1069815 RepID=A0ABD3UY29_SINWO